MKQIAELCRQYTSLSPADIAVIEGASTVLQSLADWEEADMFIDCPCRDGDAVVVAQAAPASGCSAYRRSVVGLPARRENEPAVARTFQLGIATRQMKAITQENGRTLQTVEPIRSAAGRTIGALVREQRLDAQRQASDRLHISDEDHGKIADALAYMVGNNWLTECIDEALLIVDKTGRIMFRNGLARALYERLGYLDDPLGQRYENLQMTDFAGAQERSGYETAEITFGRYCLLIKRVRLDRDDMDFAVVLQDVTARREQEKQLILKSVVVKEMHHRVKNSLQTIASLLRLQMRRLDDETLRGVLEESMNRILSIATTHELLSQSGMDDVMIGAVARNIKNNIVRTFDQSALDVEIRVGGADFPVDSDQALSIALILNELLQNSWQHAFRGRAGGSICIDVARGELYSRITVADDGCGYDPAQVRADSLGLSIVQSMVQDKLHGRLKTESDRTGTRVTMEFPNEKI